MVTAKCGRHDLTGIRCRLPFGADELTVLILTSFQSCILLPLSDIKVKVIKTIKSHKMLECGQQMARAVRMVEALGEN